MMRLMEILKEFLIQEITENTVLYHRSPIKLNPGDIVRPNKDSSGQHWMESKPAEIGMEYYRKEMNPNAPSRFHCVYSTLIPRSRFVDKGFLYEITPKGKVHITDSLLIDSIGNEFDSNLNTEFRYQRGEYAEYAKYIEELRTNPYQCATLLPYYYVKKYWNGVAPTRSNLKNLEVLSDSAVIVGEVVESEKSTPFTTGDTIQVTESNKIITRSYIYINSNDYDGEKQRMSSEDIDKLIRDLKAKILDSDADIKRNEYERYTVLDIRGTLKRGAKFVVAGINHQMKRPDLYDVRGKYANIDIDPILNGNVIHHDGKQNKYAIYNRIEINSIYNNKIPNLAKYLKKV